MVKTHKVKKRPKLTKTDREFAEHINSLSPREAEMMDGVSIGGVKLTVKPAAKKIPQPRIPKKTNLTVTCSNPKYSEMKPITSRPIPEAMDALVAAANEWKEVALMCQEILVKVKRWIP